MSHVAKQPQQSLRSAITRSRPGPLIGVAAICCGLVNGAALAQQAASPDQRLMLEEVRVTARRTSEPLQDVPVAVSVISGDQLQQQNILRGEDLQRVAPSLTVTPTVRGTGTPQYGIRGQRAGTPTMLVDPAVGVYFGEVGQSRSGGGNATLFDLESVQVLRGPQGVLFGRNNTGGAVLITPRAPSDRVEGYIGARVGNYQLRDIEGVANLPLGETWALRIAARSVDRDGYFQSIGTRQRGYDLDNENIRASLRWSPSATLTSTTIGTYFKADEAGSMLKPAKIQPAAIANPALRALISADYELQQSLDFYESAQGAGNENHRNLAKNEVVGIQNITTFALNDQTDLKNIIGWRDIQFDYCIDSLGTRSHVQRYCGLQDTEQFSNEIQLQGNSGNLDYVAGLFYFRESGDEINRNPGIAAISPFSPSLSNWVDSEAENTSYAVFMHGAYALNDRLSVSAGVRWTRDVREVDWHSRQEVAPNGDLPRRIVCRMNGETIASPSPYTAPQNARDNIDTAERDLCSSEEKVTFEEPTWSLSVDYQVTPDHLLYTAHRRGYRSGGFGPQPGNAVPGNQTSPQTLAAREPFEPEIVDDIELGSKNEFDIVGMPSTFNVAAYYAWYNDVQRVSQQIVNNTVTSRTVNAAEATIWGAELEWSVRPTPEWEVRGGYSVTKPEYETFENFYNTGTAANPVLTAVDISGASFAFIPEHQFNAGLTWRPRLPLSIGDATLSLNYYYQSDFSTSDTASSNCGPTGGFRGCLNYPVDIDGYGLWNFSADLKGAGGVRGLEIGLFVTNLADKEYYAFGVPQYGAPFGTFGVGVGEPRMAGLSARYRWGD